MSAPEVNREQSLDLGRYMVAGIMALALSLAGVMGGYQLLGAAFGTADPEEGLTASPSAAPGCPPALEAADACDYDGGPAAPERAAGACIDYRGRDAVDAPTRETIEPASATEAER
jgi:hypothetical protein